MLRNAAAKAACMQHLCGMVSESEWYIRITSIGCLISRKGQSLLGFTAEIGCCLHGKEETGLLLTNLRCVWG